MKSIDEFGSVLVMVATILGACVAVDMLFRAPDADATGSGKADVSAASMAAGNSIRIGSNLQVRLVRQTSASW